MSMTKTRQDNDDIDYESTVYVKIGIELSWLIKQDVIYEKK